MSVDILGTSCDPEDVPLVKVYVPCMLLACQVRVTVGDSGLCQVVVLRDVFRALINSLVC